MKTSKAYFAIAGLLLVLLCSSAAYAYVGPKYASRNLSYGMIGEDVRTLQKNLNIIGFLVGSEDGIFGFKVSNGVKRFQKSQSLGKDGVVGPKTFAAINNVLNKKKAVTASASSNANYKNPQITPSGNSLKQILIAKGISGAIPNLKIYVDKSDHLLTLYSGATALKSYPVSLGEGGASAKKISGDHKTPEGNFYITEVSKLVPQDQYLGTRWMRVSYPNIADAQRGLNTGLINKQTYNQIVNAINAGITPPQNTALGGGIGIHGGTDTNGPYKDWTWGCIGLFNKDVNEIFDYITVGTKLEIRQ